MQFYIERCVSALMFSDYADNLHHPRMIMLASQIGMFYIEMLDIMRIMRYNIFSKGGKENVEKN